MKYEKTVGRGVEKEETMIHEWNVQKMTKIMGQRVTA